MIPVKASSFGRRIGCARRYPGRQAVPQHLAHRLAGQPKAARGRALAHPLHIHAAPHRRIELHSIHPSVFHKTPLECAVDHPRGLVFRRPQAASPRRAVV